MLSNSLSPETQRRFLLLVRYLQALEAGDLEQVNALVQAAETDEILERMLVEANALYQSEPAEVALLENRAEADRQLVAAVLARFEGESAGRGRERASSRRVAVRSRPRPLKRLITHLVAALLGILLVVGFLFLIAPFPRAGVPVTRVTTTTEPTRTVGIIDGWRLEQIAARLDQAGLRNFNAQKFLSYAHNPATFPDVGKYPLLQHAISMEGLLFPDTYRFPADTSTVQVLDIMLGEMTQLI